MYKVIAVFIYDFGFALFKKIVSLLGRSVDEILGFKLVLFKVKLTLISFRLVELLVPSFVVLLQKSIVLEILETDDTLENLRFSQRFLEHLLVSIECLSLDAYVVLQVQILLPVLNSFLL